jgi:ParB family transcriptional regulator, chromosome partitioning protein
MTTTYLKARIYKLDISILQSDPAQPRKFIDPGSLAELSASIGKVGVLQPILFRMDGAGNHIIVAGERRVAAAKTAGLTTIPAIFVDDNYQEIALIENLQRVDLTPVEEAEAMDLMMKEHGYSQYQLSDMIGKAQSSISRTLTIAKLPEDVRTQCRTNPNIPRSVLMEVAQAKTEKGMRTRFQKYIDKAQKESAPQAARPPRLSKIAALIRETDHLHNELINLAWQNLVEEERQDLAAVLRDLRQGADDILQAMGDETTDNREPESQSNRY